MFDKFEAFMNKYLTPIANKMDKQVHLSAIKKAMVAMTPLLIIGSFCLIPEAIPNRSELRIQYRSGSLQIWTSFIFRSMSE